MFTYLLYIHVNSDVTDTFTLFRNYVYYHFIFSNIDKRGVGIRAVGWKIFQKLITGWGRLFGTRE